MNLENKILDEIINNKPSEIIKSKYQLTDKQLYYYIRLLMNKGYNIDRISNDKGIMQYYIAKKISNTKKLNTTNKIIKILAISDLHLTHKNDCIGYLDRVYEYAIKNNIHVIINLGDIIEGTKTECQKIGYKDIDNQIKYLLKYYPYDAKIANYFILGNHDVHSLQTDGIDISRILINERSDFIYCGTKNGSLQISKVLIGLFHPISTAYEGINPNGFSFVLRGHRHQFMISNKENSLNIFVPTLSDVIVEGIENINKGFLEILLDLRGSTHAFLDVIYYDLEQRLKESGRYQTKIKKNK